jgi:hypothetical protein
VAAVAFALQQAGASSCCSMRCIVGLGRPVASTRPCSECNWSRAAISSSSANRRSVGVSPFTGSEVLVEADDLHAAV